MANIQDDLAKYSRNRRDRKFTLQHMLATIAYWTLPPGIQDVLRPLRAQFQSYQLSAQEKALLGQNRGLRNHHAGTRCFILATGPSIQIQNLALLKNDLCIAVSNFFVHPDYAVIRPQYHCIAPYHLPITEEAFQAWLAELAAACGNDTELFFGLSDVARVQRHGRFARQPLYYLNFTGSWQLLLKQGIDLTRPLPAPGSITIMALLCAIYMGCNPIYLLGCDHDWITHYGESRHFYDERQHALHRQGYNEWAGDGGVEAQCQQYVELWQYYKAMRLLAEQNGSSIYNATAGGLLDLFPRVRYDALF